MSSEGPKIGGGRYREGPHEENRRPTVAAAAAFVSPIRAHPAAVGREISRPRSPGGGAPTWVARV